MLPPKKDDNLNVGKKELTTRKTAKDSTWNDWWKSKRKRNQEYLWAAEVGDLEKRKKYTTKQQMSDMVADTNTKSLDQWTAMHFAANSGHLKIANELINNKIDIEAVSTIERTPLHMASLKGHTSIAKALITAGANKNAKDFDEATPLHCASENGHVQTLEYLVEAGCDQAIKNEYGYKASDIA